MPVSDPPPLLGDGHGNYRICVIGNSGTGKTTLGAYLSTKLDVPHIPLDAIAWQPGWQKMPGDELGEKVRALMVENPRGWIIDGNYHSSLGSLVPDNATDIIWLDPPLHRYLPRLIWRTLMRILGLRAQCAPGCRETWREMFARDGVVPYAIANHGVKRAKYRAWMVRMGVDKGGKMRRLDESLGELTKWKENVEVDVLCM